MRILTDENVAASTIAMLRDLGHDVVDVREAGAAGAPDEDVCVLARSQGRLIVTHDKDFGDRLRLQSMSHRGAIILRLTKPSPDATNKALSSLLSTVGEDYLTGKLIILREHGFRARSLR